MAASGHVRLSLTGNEPFNPGREGPAQDGRLHRDTQALARVIPPPADAAVTAARV